MRRGALRFLAASALTAAALTAGFALAPARADTPVAVHNADLIKKAFRYYQAGLRSLQAGQLAPARKSFDQSIQTFPDFADAHLGLGQVSMAEKRFEEALVSFRTARDKFAGSSDALYEVRMQRFQESSHQVQEIREQIRELQSQAAISKGSNTGTEMRIRTLETQAQQLENTPQPIRGEASEPPGEVYFWIGNAEFNLQRLPEAVEAWRTCVEKSPKYPPGWNNLAVALWKQGRPAEALELLDKAKRQDVPINDQLRADLQKAVRP